MDNTINLPYLKELFSKSKDVLIRPIKINSKYNITIYLFCVDGLLNTYVLDETILCPLSLDEELKECRDEDAVFHSLLEGSAYHAFASEMKDINKVMQFVLSGMAALIFENEKKAILFDVRAFDKRSLQEPSEEGVMKGAKDSFIEVLRTNTAQIRRRIKSQYLVVEQISVGKISKTDIAIVYLSNICQMDLVDKLRTKLLSIEIDNISTPAFIEEFIEDNRKSVFPQVMYTQRPDRCSANISDGRIALVVDGIPFVYILPCELPMLMQSPEDYGENYIVGSALRMLRYITLILTLLLPAFYISVTTFHNQMLPVQWVLSIQESKLNVPFASFIEVLGLLLAFELLIEAGLRLPKTIGQAMSIVGGLVVGQAAVEANIISPAVVIIVSLTGIAGFTLANQDLSNAIRILRFGLGILASFSGFFGMTVGIIFILIHLCSLDNYGVAYLSPFVDCKQIDLKDTFLRFPIRNFKKRPAFISEEKAQKQK
jgi:hypothetical protein